MTISSVRNLTTTAFALLICAGATTTVYAAAITPQFDSFGVLNDSTGDNVEFGGDGISNQAVSITRIENNGNNITLGLTTTPRGPSAPPVGNDGAGTFFAQPGEFPDGNTDDNRSLWNFSFFTEVYGGNGTLADYNFDLLYDFDPAGGTDESDHGKFSAGAFTSGPSSNIAQGSQNPGFDYLSGSSFIDSAPTFLPFDPTVAGRYTFSLRALDMDNVLLGESAIRVNVGNVTTDVPEPSSLALLGLGLVSIGFAATSRRRGKSRACKV